MASDKKIFGNNALAIQSIPSFPKPKTIKSSKTKSQSKPKSIKPKSNKIRKIKKVSF